MQFSDTEEGSREVSKSPKKLPDTTPVVPKTLSKEPTHEQDLFPDAPSTMVDPALLPAVNGDNESESDIPILSLLDVETLVEEAVVSESDIPLINNEEGSSDSSANQSPAALPLEESFSQMELQTSSPPQVSCSALGKARKLKATFFNVNRQPPHSPLINLVPLDRWQQTTKSSI